MNSIFCNIFVSSASAYCRQINRRPSRLPRSSVHPDVIVAGPATCSRIMSADRTNMCGSRHTYGMRSASTWPTSGDTAFHCIPTTRGCVPHIGQQCITVSYRCVHHCLIQVYTSLTHTGVYITVSYRYLRNCLIQVCTSPSHMCVHHSRICVYITVSYRCVHHCLMQVCTLLSNTGVYITVSYRCLHHCLIQVFTRLVNKCKCI